LESLLEGCGFKVGVIGTVNYRFKNKVIDSKNTTPGPLELQSILAMMRRQRINFAVMEVSSHALDQERVEGITFHSAVFTNLTQDHLDYHGDLENYFQAKSRLFRSLNPRAFAVINNDDPYAARLREVTPARVVSYALDNVADFVAEDIKLNLGHTEFTLKVAGEKIRMRIPLIGRHNVYNILAAVSWGITAGLDLGRIKSALENFRLVPGRLERIENNKGLNIFVDYAHTEDALKNVITALRHIAPGRIIVVFGCGGERDKTKRPKMGRVVSELADYGIITSDNPRSEAPELIAEDIKQGINKDNYEVILDRRQAIVEALSWAKPPDVVLIAGKGHESYQIFRDCALHFDDRQVIRECLRAGYVQTK
jgi:UDP-N-acetylmuramoyl-L-alanyl-D-glutamate--2,6-diaminopimelate ligase